MVRHAYFCEVFQLLDDSKTVWMKDSITSQEVYVWTVNVKVQVGGHQGQEKVLDLLVLTYRVLRGDLKTT